MYKDTGCKSAFEFHSKCFNASLGLLGESLDNFEEFVSTFVDQETQSALKNTLYLYLADAYEHYCSCHNFFDTLVKDHEEVSYET